MKLERRLIFALLLVAVPLSGCLRRAGPPAPPPVTMSAQAAQADDPGAQVKRGMERQVNQNLLHQIGLFYQTYQAETGRPPPKPEDFLNYIQRDGHKEYAALKDDTLVLHLVSRQDSNSVLCYEKTPDLNGNRLVLMGDGSAVRLMNDADFQAALKAGQK